MRTSSKSLLLATIASLAFAVTPSPAHAQTDSQEREALRIYQEGVELANQKRWEDAADKFERVAKIRAATPVLFALAEAQSHTSELRAAKRNYERAIEMSGSEYADVAQQARSSLARLNTRIPRVTLKFSTDVHSKRVTLNSDEVSNPDEPIELDPGKDHQLAVTASGYEPFEASVKLDEGERSDLPVDLRKVAPTTAEPAASPTPPAASDESFVDSGPMSEPTAEPLPLGPIVLGGAGVVVTAVGVGIRLSGKSAYDSAVNKCEDAPRCDDQAVVDDGNDARGRMVVGTVIAGVGVAAIAGAGVWWVVTRDTETEQVGLSLTAVPAVGGGFATLRGRF